MGHSIGQWEGDTFVIDTIGFNEETWLDRLGHPHSDALHVVERIRRLDHDTLEYGVTVEDPKAYAAPWTGRMVFKLRSDWEILEHSCTTKATRTWTSSRRRGRPGVRALRDEHRVPITVEPITSRHRVAVRLENPLAAGECRDEDKQ